MENKKKKVVLITTIVIISAVICSVGGYTVYKQNKIKERSAKVKAEIVGNWEKFDKEEERSKKLEIFEKVETDKSAYQKEKDYQEEVVKEFDNLLKKMKSFFSDDYDKAIAENTLADIEKNTDKEKITTAKGNLENVLNIIESEKSILKLEKAEEKISDIQELITQYTDRMKAIEEEEAKKKAEEEARKKAEAEEEARKKAEAEEEARKKAEAEVAAQAQNNSESSSNNGNYDSSSTNNWSGDGSSDSSGGGASSNNGGGSSSSGRYVIRTEYFTVNGKSGTRYFYNDGTVEIVMDDGTIENVEDPNGDIYG